jgi:hypothetical protein
MILSHSKQFIFFKTPKTAGTSVEIALSKICSDIDVITPITKADEKLRISMEGRTAQNHESSLWLNIRGKGYRFYNHMGAHEVRALVSADVWQSYKKFAFVRNPWDQVVSGYYMKKRSGKYTSFDSYMSSGSWKKNADETKAICTLNGERALDHYYQYERLEDAIQHLFSELDSPTPELAKAKAGYRQDGGNYQEHFTNKQQQEVTTYYRWLLDIVPYEF